jgi:hypothetical protein
MSRRYPQCEFEVLVCKNLCNDGGRTLNVNTLMIVANTYRLSALQNRVHNYTTENLIYRASWESRFLSMLIITIQRLRVLLLGHRSPHPFAPSCYRRGR